MYSNFCIGNNDAIYFEIVNETSRYKWEVVNYISKIIVPLYRDPNYPTRMVNGADRITELLLVNNNPTGIISYKKQLTNEFETYGIIDSFEIKTLLVIDPEINSGKGYGSILLNRIIDVAKKCKANSIHATLSESVPDSIQFFLKKGFIVKHEWTGTYRSGVKEYLVQYII